MSDSDKQGMPSSSLFASLISRTLTILAVLILAMCWLKFNTLEWPFGAIDTPIILAQAILYSPFEYFLDPQKYQFLSLFNYTPMVTLSLDFDYTLFGLESRGYRAHQLVSLAVLLTVIYLLLKKVTGSTLNASLFAFAALNLPATHAVVDDLISRHYLEGMCFALLSVYFFFLYKEKKSVGLWGISVLFYALSIFSKEVYLPLPAILFFLAPFDLARRIRFILPYGLALLAYLALRIYILDGVGGYSSASSSLDLLLSTPILLSMVKLIATTALGTPEVSGVMLAVLVLCLALNLRQLRATHWLALMAASAGLMLPIIALLPSLALGFLDLRWFLAISTSLLLFFSYLTAKLTSGFVRALVYLAIAGSSLHAYYEKLQEPVPAYARGTGQLYKDILRADASSYIRVAKFSQFALDGYSVWPYVARLHGGNWGTLLVSHPAQSRYHDLSGKEPILAGSKKAHRKPWKTDNSSAQDVVASSRYDPETGQVSINFLPVLEGEKCWVYIYGQNNGRLSHYPSCRNWIDDLQLLRYNMRLRGYELEETYLAVWSDLPGLQVYSRPYRLSELFDFPPDRE